MTTRRRVANPSAIRAGRESKRDGAEVSPEAHRRVLEHPDATAEPKFDVSGNLRREVAELVERVRRQRKLIVHPHLPSTQDLIEKVKRQSSTGDEKEETLAEQPEWDAPQHPPGEYRTYCCCHPCRVSEARARSMAILRKGLYNG